MTKEEVFEYLEAWQVSNRKKLAYVTKNTPELVDHITSFNQGADEMVTMMERAWS